MIAAGAFIPLLSLTQMSQAKSAASGASEVFMGQMASPEDLSVNAE